MGSIQFNPVCVNFQKKIRDYFGWKLEDDEIVLNWLKNKICSFSIKWNEASREKYLEDLIIKIKSNDDFIVIGANISKKEIMDLPKNTPLVVADGAIGAIMSFNEALIKNVICLMSDGDGLPYIKNNKIKNLTIILHAHGHAQKNLEHVLSIWKAWNPVPKVIISHQTPISSKGAYNFGGFSDGDRGVCLLHSLGVPKNKINILGFNSNKIGSWGGLSNSKIKHQKLKWMGEILNSLGYEI